MTLTKKLFYFLRDQEFVTLATVSADGSPHVSPKLFLKAEKKHIYLIDFLVGWSFKNIKQNDKIAIATFDIKKVEGYHIYGTAKVIKKGPGYQELLSEWGKRQTQMATEKISETVHGTQNIRSLNLTFVKPVKIYKVAIGKIDFINSEGSLVTQDIAQ